MSGTIKALCTPGIYSVGLDATILDASKTMLENKKGAVLIVDDGKLRGILTERDIVTLLSKGVDLGKKAYSCASLNVITINFSRSLIQALIIMAENDIRRLAVADDTGRIVGLITQQDLVTQIEDDAYRSSLKISHIKDTVKNIVYISEEESLANAIKLMNEYNISSIPIFKNNKPLGIISEKDMITLATENIDLNSPVKDHMSSPVVSVNEDSLVVDVVAIMNERNIRRVLVTDNENNCLGIITQKDILKNFENDYKSLAMRKLKYTKDMFNLLPEMVVEVLDSKDEQIVVWANNKALEFFGKSVVDKQIDKLLGREEWVSMYLTILDAGRVDSVKIGYQGGFYEISGFYLRSEDINERGRIKLIIRDITDSEKSKEVIRHELDTYLRIMNSTADIILLYGAYDGKIKIANDSALKSIGVMPDEIKEMTIYDIVAEDKEFLDEKISAIIKEDKIVKGTRTYRRSNKETFPVDITATKVILENSIYILIVARDISEKLQMEKLISRRNDELTHFHNFINSLNRSSSIEESYDVLSFYLKHIGIDAVHIYKINPSLTRISESSVNQDKMLWCDDCLSSDINSCKVVLSGTNFIKNSNKNFGCPLAKLDKSIKSYMCQNIYSSGKLIAIISLLSTKEEFFDNETNRFLSDLFNAFSLLVSNLRLIEINKELSIRDPLTGLYNRRFLGEFLEKEIERSKRNDSHLSIIMIDLDDFKLLNDRYGHETGDMALKIVATTIQKHIRKGDIVSRFGGEEFLVVMPNSDKENTTNSANRIREALANAAIESIKGGRLYITASLGVASMKDDNLNDSDQLIILADNRLYGAKGSGKNITVNE